MRSRRGTYLMEAALVLPVILLTVITVVLIVMFFYESSSSQSELHQALRYESGTSSGKMFYPPESEAQNFAADSYFEHSRRSIAASRDIAMIHRGLLYRRGSKTLRGSIRVSDGTTYVLRRQKVSEFLERSDDKTQ